MTNDLLGQSKALYHNRAWLYMWVLATEVGKDIGDFLQTTNTSTPAQLDPCSNGNRGSRTT